MRCHCMSRKPWLGMSIWWITCEKTKIFLIGRTAIHAILWHIMAIIRQKVYFLLLICQNFWIQMAKIHQKWICRFDGSWRETKMFLIERTTIHAIYRHNMAKICQKVNFVYFIWQDFWFQMIKMRQKWTVDLIWRTPIDYWHKVA